MPGKIQQSTYLSKVFMDATDAIIIEDLDGMVLDVNREAERAYGWSRKELVGQSYKKLVPEFRSRHADELLERCAAGEDIRNIEAVRITKNGESRIVLLAMSSLRDEKGTAVAIASYAKDITDLKGEAAERERMAKVFMDATDAIIIETLEGVILDVNRAAVDAYGYSREELIGNPIKLVVPDERHEGADDLLRRCIAGEELRNIEVVRDTKTGERVVVLLTLSLLHDAQGKPMSIASYAKDITELRRVEEQQRKEREEVIAAQAQSLAELSTPVTEVWEGILLLPIVGIVDSRRAHDIMNSVLETISEKQARHIILDISGVGVVDTAVANHFIKISKATQLMGCRCAISGVSPAIAQTMVELGIDVGTMSTTSTMRDALRAAFKQAGVRIET
jgi:methyl-accepting chemotaxis protein